MRLCAFADEASSSLDGQVCALLRNDIHLLEMRGESHIPQIPDRIRMEIARCLLPDIVAYFESEEGQKEFSEWKVQQELEQNQKTRTT